MPIETVQRVARPTFRYVTPALSIGQIIGWGTTYYLPTTLSLFLTRDLGLGREMVFGGVTIMLLVSGAIGPHAGRFLDRSGARLPMCLGSVLMAVALVILSRAEGLMGYVAAWVFIGLGAPLALTQGAAAAIAQTSGDGARRSMGMLFLVGGLASAVFWPLTAWLSDTFGWRETLVIFAALHVFVCLPLHALALGRREQEQVVRTGELPVVMEPLALTPEERRSAFILMAAAFSFIGFVTWGIPLLIIDVLKGFGLPASFAIAAGAAMGPAQILSRMAEMMFGQRLGLLMVGVIATAIMPLAMTLPLVVETGPMIAIGFVVGYGMSAGAMTIVRNAAPLMLFGRATYATMNGWLLLPQNLAFAAAPIVFAAALTHGGPTAPILLALVSSLAALAAMVLLERRFGAKAEKARAAAAH
ncbi:MFS transporter [Phreatobacter aquaticus]|nr:MFS transporter [Phreatobacter aquaticus]